MRRFTIIFFFLVIFLLWNTSIATAQFFEAGVQKVEPPITAPDFTLNKLGGGKVSLRALRGKVILLDKDGSVAKAYRVFGHHETFFINRQGKILGKTFALKDWTSPNVRNLIQYLLAEDK